MHDRIKYATVAPDAYKTMFGVRHCPQRCGLDERLLSLIYLRAPQIDECAYCIDAHWKDLRATDEREPQLHMLAVWREWPEFTARERAALEWIEETKPGGYQTRHTD